MRRSQVQLLSPRLFGGIMAKRVLDQFDLEAEREAGAIRRHGGIPTCRYGKGITKQRNMHKRGSEIQTTRIVKRERWMA
jgi:hypothetical protein